MVKLVRLHRLAAGPVVVGALLAATTATAATPPGATAPAKPGPVVGTPGGGSIGDSLYPTIGNTGYDALHYDVNLTFGAKSTDPFSGRITLIAKATQALSRFSLDYTGKSVGAVSVNGAPAKIAFTGEKLVVTPRTSLRSGAPFVVSIGGYSATPNVPGDGDFVGPSVALAAAPSGIFTAGQTVYASSWFPSNDTPADKASFTFELTAPADQTAVANGVLLNKRRVGGAIRWTYLQRQPMATELLQLAVGQYSVIDRGRVGRVQVRDVVAKSEPSQSIGKLLGVEKEQLEWMQAKVGLYPFDAYGTLIADTPLGFALETQTLSLFDPSWWDPTTSYYSEGYWKSVMNHELTHQWFGDSVAPKDWVDIWLNEGHATYYEYTWADDHGYLLDDSFISEDFDEVNQQLYAWADQDRHDYGPVGRPLSNDPLDVFSYQAYTGGSLVLYALRQKIGTPKFEQLERTWVAKYSGGNATTKDYIALASKVSGQDLTKFLNDWLYGLKTPPMPGHPDWTTNPVVTAPTTARVMPAGMRADFRKR